MIWVLAGTSEGRNVAAALNRDGFPVVATTVTEYGADILRGLDLAVEAAALDAQGMIRFIEKRGIGRIIDATHPFAEEASVNARSAAEQTGAEYIRFGRRATQVEGSNVVWVSDFEIAAKIAVGYGSRMFLAIGAKKLGVFVENARARGVDLIARVLPLRESLEHCRALGLAGHEIIAARGPFTIEENETLFNEHEISVVVTKESGKAGGSPEKIQAAANFDIPVVLIERPSNDEADVFDYEALTRLLRGVC